MTTASNAQTTGTTSTASKTQWTGKVPPKLADVGQRLQAAGYKPASAAGSKEAKGVTPFIRVLMHEGAAAFVGVAGKGTTKQQIAQSVARFKGRLAAELVGSNVYVASTGDGLLDGKTSLTVAQIAEFHKIVAAGSGQ